MAVSITVSQHHISYASSRPADGSSQTINVTKMLPAATAGYEILRQRYEALTLLDYDVATINQQGM